MNTRATDGARFERLISIDWIGDADQCAEVRQYARDQIWEGYVEDAEFAADEVIGSIETAMPWEIADGAREILRGALIESAERHRRRVR